MTKTAKDSIANVEVLTIVTECYGGGGPGGPDKRGETKMTVLVGESGCHVHYERNTRRRLRHCVQRCAESRQ